MGSVIRSVKGGILYEKSAEDAAAAASPSRELPFSRKLFLGILPQFVLYLVQNRKFVGFLV